MNTQFNRTAVLVSLGLSIVLVVGVLFGTKYFFDNVARQPVSVSAIDSPESSSPLCEELVENLPERFMGEKRSELAELTLEVLPRSRYFFHGYGFALWGVHASVVHRVFPTS